MVFGNSRYVLCAPEMSVEGSLINAEQQQWADIYLLRLFEMDNRQIFTLALYVPPRTAEKSIKKTKSERWFVTDQQLDLCCFVDKESRSEAGNMVVSGKWTSCH